MKLVKVLRDGRLMVRRGVEMEEYDYTKPPPTRAPTPEEIAKTNQAVSWLSRKQAIEELIDELECDKAELMRHYDSMIESLRLKMREDDRSSGS